MKKAMFALCAASLVMVPAFADDAAKAYEFKLDQWTNPGLEKGAVFEISDVSDGVLHLKDEADGKYNNTLQRRMFGRSLAAYKGKRVTFTAEVLLISASRDNCVGLSLNYRTPDKKTITQSDYVPGKGSGEWQKVSVSIDVPQEIEAFGLVIECARGYSNKAEAKFRNFTLTVSDIPAEISTGGE